MEDSFNSLTSYYKFVFIHSPSRHSFLVYYKYVTDSSFFILDDRKFQTYFMINFLRIILWEITFLTDSAIETVSEFLLQDRYETLGTLYNKTEFSVWSSTSLKVTYDRYRALLIALIDAKLPHNLKLISCRNFKDPIWNIYEMRNILWIKRKKRNNWILH